MPAPVFGVHHARTGVVALNVVTAALDADPRTDDTVIHFAKTPAEMIEAIAMAAAQGAPVVAGWSFYSIDFAAAAADLAAVREAMGPAGKIYFGAFPSECRPEHVSAEALALLKRYTDNTGIIIGAQSGSDRVLAATRRGHSVDDVLRAVRLTLGAGLRPDVDFIFGLPGESPEDRAASLRLAESLVALGARIHGHAFMPLPGTPLRDAEPEPIEPEIEYAMARLEAQGAMYGQRRRQLVSAEELVRRRRQARSAP